MSRFQDIYDEAGELYNKDRKYDAAVIFEQARRIAKADQMAAEAAEAGVWAAISWNLAAHPLKAYGLLMEILSTADDDLKMLLRWFVRTTVFQITLYFFPDLDKLQKRLESLSQFQQEYLLPISDVHQFTGHLLGNQGKWTEALVKYELAWSQYDGDGYFLYHTAANTCLCNLRLGNLAAAQRWCDRLGETETDSPFSRITWYTLQANLGLYGLCLIRIFLNNPESFVNQGFWEQSRHKP